MITSYKELNSKICNLRCELEELAEEVNELWCAVEGYKISTLLSELEDCLKDTADSVGEWEDNEELEDEFGDEDN